MAGAPFDRMILHPLEKALSPDINLTESQLDAALRECVKELLAYQAVSPDGTVIYPGGFAGFSFKLTSQGGLNVAPWSGVAFVQSNSTPININGIVGLNDEPSTKPIFLLNPELITIPAPDPLLDRWDLVEVTYNRQILNPQARQILNPATGVYAPANVDKTLSFMIDGQLSFSPNPPLAMNYRIGTPNAVPVKPTVHPGYLAVGYIYVPAAAVAVDESNFYDARRTLTANGVLTASFHMLCDFNTANGGTYGTFIQASASLPPGYKGAVYFDTTGGPPADNITFYLEGGDIARLGDHAPPDVPAVNVTVQTVLSITHDPLIAAMPNLTAFALGAQPPVGAGISVFPAVPPTFGVHVPVLSGIIYPSQWNSALTQWDQSLFTGGGANQGLIHINITVTIPTGA